MCEGFFTLLIQSNTGDEVYEVPAVDEICPMNKWPLIAYWSAFIQEYLNIWKGFLYIIKKNTYC